MIDVYKVEVDTTVLTSGETTVCVMDDMIVDEDTVRLSRMSCSPPMGNISKTLVRLTVTVV